MGDFEKEYKGASLKAHYFSVLGKLETYKQNPLITAPNDAIGNGYV
jgi:hypothetical protein